MIFSIARIIARVGFGSHFLQLIISCTNTYVLIISPDQGDVGSNPAQGNCSFPQKLSRVEFPVTFIQFLLNLDCESICDPPGGDTLLAQGIHLTDSLH